ncbi:helix-turn-helix domain-containing protein [Streptomyces roseolus]|uniref:helix-turn-helix domain-containing protein n=1 Tax=Streptomyces roseolus TaxID=67358 RepID=UPI0037AF9D72
MAASATFQGGIRPCRTRRRSGSRPRPGPRQGAAELRKKYGSGTSIRALGKENDRSYGGVHRLLVDAGVTFRSRGGDRCSAES